MKLIVITNEEGEETQNARELADNVAAEGFEVEKIDWESEEATTLAALHDIYSTPAFIIVSDNGSQVELWQGSRTPLASEIKHLM